METRPARLCYVLLVCLLAIAGTSSVLFGDIIRLVRPDSRGALASRQCGITRGGLNGHAALIKKHDAQAKADRKKHDAANDANVPLAKADKDKVEAQNDAKKKAADQRVDAAKKQ